MALVPHSPGSNQHLGAGACWCSDWLERLNLRAVSVDISRDMLALGRTRLRDARRLVAGDVERQRVLAGWQPATGD